MGTTLKALVPPILSETMSQKSRWVRLARGMAFATGLGLVAYLSAQVALAQGNPGAVPGHLSPSELAVASSILGFVGGWLRAGEKNNEGTPAA